MRQPSNLRPKPQAHPNTEPAGLRSRFTMLHSARLAVAFAAAALFLVHAADRPVEAAAQPDRLNAVLAQMDASSKSFRFAEADIRKDHLEKLVNDTSTESGTIYFLRTGSSVQVGLRLQVGKPDEKVMEYKNGVARLYTAVTNHIDTASAGGKNQAKADTFVTLGFGGSGSELKKAWDITDLGSEQMTDGGKSITVEKLDLVSKDPGVRNNYSHITIWIDPTRDVSLKQESFTPSGDTDTATFTNIRLTQPNLGAYAIKCKGPCN